MQTVLVGLGERQYPIYIGENLLANRDLLRKHSSQQIFVITQEIIAKKYLPFLKNGYADSEFFVHVMRDGEQEKSLNTFNEIITNMLESSCHRQTTVVALGGGVVGDIAGFVAASYQRGVDIVQIPTTLLAQTDSSIGGKTAINHALGKNMIGAFHQPKAVIIDTNTLRTLPRREFVAGIAEIIKYALLCDEEFFVWLEKNLESLLHLEPVTMMYAIEKSCRIKAKIVEEDEMDFGIRNLLNLGHTFAHAIENVFCYGTWLHGEAVATGIILASRLSQRMNLLDENSVERIVSLIKQVGLPDSLPVDTDHNRFMQVMQKDKKVVNGKMHFILLERIGKACINDSVDESVVRDVLKQQSVG